MRRKLKVKSKARSDYLIMTCLALLVAFGLAMLASASSHLGTTKFGDPYYYLKHQLIYGLSIGLIGYFIMSKIYYRRLEKYALVALIISIGLLALVFTPLGVQAKGAARWLALGPITFQPSEIVKLTFIIYLAAWLSGEREREKKLWTGFLPFLLVLGLIAGLLLYQPSTSAAAIFIFTALAVYFAGGARLRYLTLIGITALLGLLLIIYLTPYRWERILSFLEPETNLETTGFHRSQALIAIGSGGLKGVGFGQSTTKISYLPEPIGDSIFAVAAEEFGFIGSSVIILIFFILVLRIFLLARRCPDKFGQLLLTGFGILIAIQTFIHVGAISGLLPLTGTPLPFVSYGGTALAVFMTMGGIIVNISKYS